MQTTIKKQIDESIKTKQSLYDLIPYIEKAANLIIDTYKKGKKVLIAGNGGSASDAQHFAAELVVRFKSGRDVHLSCTALTTDTSILTACGNDYGFDYIFAVQIDAHGEKDDLYIGLTTGGNSPNMIEAIKKAKEKGLKTISLLGKDGGKIKGMADLDIIVNSYETARIQEGHQTIYHVLADLVTKEFFKQK